MPGPPFAQPPLGYPSTPLYLPAGPPGTPYDAADAMPGVVVAFRLYMGMMVLFALCIAGFGIVGATTAGFSGGTPKTDDVVVGIICCVMGFAMAVPHIIVLVGGRRPWVHTMGTVMLALSLVSGGGCCMIPAVVMLVYWTNAETKRWFETGPST